MIFTMLLTTYPQSLWKWDSQTCISYQTCYNNVRSCFFNLNRDNILRKNDRDTVGQSVIFNWCICAC